MSKENDGLTPDDPGTGKKISIKPYTEKLILDESLFDRELDEEWYHFEFTDGSNPYIAKSKRERDRLFRKYKGRIKEIKDNFYVVDMEEEKKDLFSVDEAKETKKNKHLSICENVNKQELNEELMLIMDIGDYRPWSGAVDTWDKIVDNDAVEDLEMFLEELYPEGLTVTQLNDILWFEDEWVLESLGLSEEEDEDEDDMEESLSEEEELDEDASEKPLAVLGLTNTMGIGIYSIDDESLTYAFNGDEKHTAEIEWECEDGEEECRPYFLIAGQKYYLDEFIRTDLFNEAVQTKVTKRFKLTEDKDMPNDVYDFVYGRLFNEKFSNFTKHYNFLNDFTVNVTTEDGKKKKTSVYSPDTYVLSDNGISLVLTDESEGALAQAVADELGLEFEIKPFRRAKQGAEQYKFVATVKIPEEIMEMPIKDYLESIGKSLKDYELPQKKRGRKAEK